MIDAAKPAETPEDNALLWSKRLLLIAYLADREGFKVEFVPYNPENLVKGFKLSYLKINNKLTSIQVVANVQTWPGRQQVSAATGITLHTLLEVSVVCMIICPNGYSLKMLHIPATDLLHAYFDDEVNESENVRKTFMIPMAYRPENPRFDFLKYEDDWSVYL